MSAFLPALDFVTLVSLVCAFVVLGVSVALYQDASNSLNRFPGPYLARWTGYYQAYFDIVKDGGWLDHLQELHRKYAIKVRSSVLARMKYLHFSDPLAYGDIYSNPKSMKDPKAYGAFLQPLATLVQTDSREVSARKPLISPFFSRQAVLNNLQETITFTVDKLLHQLTANHSTGKIPANLNLAYRSTAFDIISTYCFAKSPDIVSSPAFQSETLVGLDTSLSSVKFTTHSRIIRTLASHMPDWLGTKLGLKAVLDQTKDIVAMVDETLRTSEDADSDHRTIFSSILEGVRNGEYASRRESQTITRAWLIDEGVVLRFAGSDTTSNACTIGTRCLLADPRMLEKLMKELDEAWPDKNTPVKLEILERLPYLTAVIKESLRLSHGTVSPMKRVIGAGGAKIAGLYVPEGTSVAMGNTFVHLSPQVFPEPTRFYPERWLESNSGVLEKYLVAFGKGPRSCLGVNLAWCEMYVILGSIFRKLDLKPTVDVSSPWKFKEYFLPVYEENILHVTVRERP
ncbi:cytochrome P450 [Dendrothele bispora CBS 962.96]|uniref:Cytochrome P450 n=1 Tax=Dendrothele bispora (strain CBS 962.96) TaxID=1314807 RepID=A0A4S8MIN6_DENBC|nr:cytochrome P450 [Dendrothele bispora CBS 962.96]